METEYPNQFYKIFEMDTEAERRRIAAQAMCAIITNGHYQIAEEDGAKTLKIAKRINDFWLVQCDEIKQLFLDLTARRYTEIAIMHK